VITRRVRGCREDGRGGDDQRRLRHLLLKRLRAAANNHIGIDAKNRLIINAL